MIEKCAYCQEVHETGKGLLTDGIPLKECPYVHPHQPFFFNPKEWLRYGDSEYFHRNDSNGHSLAMHHTYYYAFGDYPKPNRKRTCGNKKCVEPTHLGE